MEQIAKKVIEGYVHGRIFCKACFPAEEEKLSIGDWRLLNNPGYYGSSNPEILVLGFSKGTSQITASEKGDFDKIAFANMRHRLKQVLETLKIMPADRDIDALMTAKEKKFGLTSLVRCSLCKMKGENCITSGTIVSAAFTNNATLKIIEQCVIKFLSTLPTRTKLVVLLGISDSYLSKTKKIFRKVFKDFFELNSVAFRAGEALWVYGAHPSPMNGHFKAWVAGPINNRSGSKREDALSVLPMVL